MDDLKELENVLAVLQVAKFDNLNYRDCIKVNIAMNYCIQKVNQLKKDKEFMEELKVKAADPIENEKIKKKRTLKSERDIFGK